MNFVENIIGIRSLCVVETEWFPGRIIEGNLEYYRECELKQVDESQLKEDSEWINDNKFITVKKGRGVNNISKILVNLIE